MSREIRNTTHQKQNRMQVQRGVPNIAELSEAVPVLRSVPGIGIVEYIRYNGQLYSSAYSTSEPIVSNTSDNISLINDGAVGVYSFEGTVSNSIDAPKTGDLGAESSGSGAVWGFSTEIRADKVHITIDSIVDDVAALASKINEIIRVLRRAHIIGYDGRFGDTLGA